MALGFDPVTGKIDAPTSKGGSILDKGASMLSGLFDFGGFAPSSSQAIGRFGDVNTGATTFGQPKINFGSAGNPLIYGALALVGVFFIAKALKKR